MTQEQEQQLWIKLLTLNLLALTAIILQNIMKEEDLEIWKKTLKTKMSNT
ncbi:MAG: hypothetical protein QXV82_09970 [Ignisphaera sp.]